MNRADGHQRHPEDEHDDAWLLLPWLANGTLDAEEAQQVGSHVAACERCRHELERCQDLAAALRSGPETAPTPHPLQLARLMARLTESDEIGESDEIAETDEIAGAGEVNKAGEVNRAGVIAQAGERVSPAVGALRAPAAGGVPPAAHASGKRRRLAGILTATPRPVRFALAGQLAALLALALALSFGLRAPGGGRAPHGAATLGTSAASRANGTDAAVESGPATGASAPARALFHTLSAPSPGSGGASGSDAAAGAAPRPQIRLVFAEQATEKQIREVLMKVRGRLVDGPSPLGTYTIEIPAPPAAAIVPAAPGASAAAASRQARAARPLDGAPDSLGIVLAYLTSQPIVRFAEPVAGMPSANPQALPQP